MSFETKIENYKLVNRFFREDMTKTIEWFIFPNSLLGMQSPIQMHDSGREEKLNKFIKAQLDGNEWIS